MSDTTTLIAALENAPGIIVLVRSRNHYFSTGRFHG